MPQPKNQGKTWDKSHFITPNTSPWAIYTPAYTGVLALYEHKTTKHRAAERVICFPKKEKKVLNSLVQLHDFTDFYWFINALSCQHWRKGWRCSLHCCLPFEHHFKPERSARNGVGPAGWPGAGNGLGHLGKGTVQPYFCNFLWNKLMSPCKIR